jgi:hypothetical protein
MTYRVIQWETGVIGRSGLRALIARPEFDLVGLYTENPAEAGQEAGEIVGVAPTGIVAADDVEQILTLKADCVAYLVPPAVLRGRDTGFDASIISRLLASGKNVVTTAGFVNPKARDPGVAAMLEDACQAGGTSLYGTWINPGFMTAVLPLTFSGLSVRIDHVYVRECFDLSNHPYRWFVVDLLGLTKDPADHARVIRPYRAYLQALFTECMHLVADGIGVELEAIEETFEYEVAARSFEIATGTMPAGGVSGARWSFVGVTGGRPFITFEFIKHADPSLASRGPSAGITLRITGQPSLTVVVDEVTNDLMAAAAHAINSIPAVCAAAPGIRTVLDLPPAVGRGAARTV